MLTREDARVIFAALMHDGLRAADLSAQARAEIKAAIDVLLKVTK
jgi:hypothetical protein